MTKRLTTEEFIERCKKIHKGKDYDYSLVDYKNNSTKIQIICQEHGVFEKLPANIFSRKEGCPFCKGVIKVDTELFIERCEKIHNNFYDYSRVNYINNSTNVEIGCPTCGKFFFQTPASHMAGCKCNLCFGPRNKTLDEFKERATSKHNNKYDYSKVEFSKLRDVIVIKCPVHDEYEQVAQTHLSGSGCPRCAGKVKSNKKEFEEKSRNVHGNRYDYSQVDYINEKTKVNLRCEKHGVFSMKPTNHIHGKQGCPSCAKYGFDSNQPAIVYYLSINNGKAYKIGITNRAVKNRFTGELDKIKIVKEWSFTRGEEARLFEKGVLEEYKDFQYTGDPLLRAGNTELFNHDILNLDH